MIFFGNSVKVSAIHHVYVFTYTRDDYMCINMWWEGMQLGGQGSVGTYVYIYIHKFVCMFMGCLWDVYDVYLCLLVMMFTIKKKSVHDQVVGSKMWRSTLVRIIRIVCNAYIYTYIYIHIYFKKT